MSESMAITNARLVGALVKSLPPNTGATSLIKYVEPKIPSFNGEESGLTDQRQRVLVSQVTTATILNLNSILLESPASLTQSYVHETLTVICNGIKDRNVGITVHQITQSRLNHADFYCRQQRPGCR